MIGYPKTLSTKEDYLYVKENFERSQWERDFQNLLDTRNEWFDVEEVESLEAGVTDETHRVIVLEEESDDGAKQIFMQQELRFSENCPMVRLGFTEEEVRAALAS